MLDPAWNAGTAVAQDLGDSVNRNVVQPASRSIQNNVVNPAWNAGANAVGQIGQGVNQGVNDFKTGLGVIGQGAQDAWQGAQQAGQDVMQGAQQFGQDAMQGAQQVGQDFKTGLGVIGQGAQQFGQDAMQGAQQVGQDVMQGAQQLGQGMWDAGKAVAPHLSPMVLGPVLGPPATAMKALAGVGQNQQPAPAAQQAPPQQAQQPAFNPGEMPPGYILARDGGVNGQAPQQPMMAAPPAQPAPAGPSNDYLQRVMGSYDPNSAFDQRKADAIRQIWSDQGGQVSPNAVYADPRYSQIKSAFALLDPEHMEKTAFLTGIGDGISGVWNRTAKPMMDAGKKMVGGVGDVLGGAGKALWNGATALPRAGMAAAKGAWTGQGQPGLQGIVGGAFNGAKDSLWNSGARQLENIGQIGTGAGNAVMGNLESVGRGIAAPYTSAYGFLAGPGDKQPTQSRGQSSPALAGPPPTTSGSQPTPYSPKNYYRPPATNFGQLTSGHGGGMPNATTGATNEKVTSAAVRDVSIDEVATPFAILEDGELEKSASLRYLAGGLERLGAAAGNYWAKGAPGSRDIFKRVGELGIGGANKIRGLDPRVTKGLNIGLPVLAGGGALYGANRMGYNSGERSGVGRGFTRGLDAGVNAMASQMPGQQGVMGRLLNVFRGSPTGPDAAAVRGMLEENKQTMLRQILEGPRGRA